MALLLRKRLILIETESSYGTDPTPTGADAVLVKGLEITPQSSDVVSRDLIRPYLGASQQHLAAETFPKAIFWLVGRLSAQIVNFHIEPPCVQEAMVKSPASAASTEASTSRAPVGC